MKLFSVVLCLIGGMAMAADKNIAIVIHGGAGTIQRDQLSAAQEQGIRQDLQAALDAGYAVLDLSLIHI